MMKILSAILLLSVGAFTQQIPVNYAKHGYDVTAYGAKGDRKTVTDANAVVCASAPCTVTSASAAFTAADTGKLFYLDTDATNSSRKLPKGLTVATAGACSGSAGVIDTRLGARNVYVKFSYKNANGTGRPSFEEFVVIPTNATVNNCVIVTQPAAGGNSATNYVVEASIDPGDKWPQNTAVSLGYIILDSNGKWEKVTTAGTTNNSAEPTWSTTYGGTTADGTAVWTEIGVPVPGYASGLETIQAACNNVAIASTCELDTVTTSGVAITEPAVDSGTMTFVNATTITVNQTIPNQITANYLSYGTDNNAAITLAATQAAAADPKGNINLYVPAGNYLVSCPGLVFGSTSTYFTMTGDGGTGDSSNAATANLGTINAGLSFIATGGNCPVITIGTSGQTMFAAPQLRNMAWGDASGVGNAAGGVLLYANTGAVIENNSFVNFSRGYGLECNAGSTSLFCQYDAISNPQMINVQNGIVFTGGKVNSNWIRGGRLVSSILGGGVGVDFQFNGGATTGSGSNLVDGARAYYFPLGFHSVDHQGDSFINARAESSFALSGAVNPAGGSGFGTGMFLDGTAATAFCKYAQVDGAAVSTYGGLIISPACDKSRITNFSADTVTGTQFIVADPATNYVETDQKNGLVISQGSTSTQFGMNTSGVTTVSQINCFPGSGSTCAITNNTQTNVGIAIGTNNQSSSNIGAASLTTGAFTGSGAATIGDATVKGGNYQGTDAASLAGNTVVGPGASTGWVTTGPQNGNLQIFKYFGKPAVSVVGDVERISSTNYRLEVCPTSCLDFVGVNVSSTGTATRIQLAGDVTVNFDGTYSPSSGWFACTSPTTAGKILPQAAACSAGRQVGILEASGSSATTGVIWIKFQ